DLLAGELIAGCCGIPEAVDRLLTMEKRQDQVWMTMLREAYALESDRDCLAANFVNHVLRFIRREPELAGRVPEWLAAYEAHLRVPGNPPWKSLEWVTPDTRAALKRSAATPPPARPET